MVLRFRTRLSILISALILLVISAMTVAVGAVFAWDMFNQIWSQGETRHTATHVTLEHALESSDRARERLTDMLVFETVLADELSRSTESSAGNIRAALTRARERLQTTPVSAISVSDAAKSDGPDIKVRNAEDGITVRVRTATGTILENRAERDAVEAFVEDTSLARTLSMTMVPRDYDRIGVIDRDGRVLAAEGPEGPGGAELFTDEMLAFAKGYIRQSDDKRRDYEPLLLDNYNLAVVTALSPETRDERLALLVVHPTSRSMELIFSRLGVIASVGLVMLIVGLLASILMSRSLGKPIVQLSAGAREFGKGNLNYRLRWSRKDEFNDLAQSFNTMAISLQEYMHELEQETAKRERFESEFRIAAEMQQTLLPDHPPESANLDVLGWTRPSREVGGDFYDFIELDENRIGLVVGDATGKGVSAALLTTQCASILRTIAHDAHDAGEILRRTNREFHKRVASTHRFVTLFLMIVNTDTGAIRYASAGHPAPYLVHGGGRQGLWLECEPAFPLGLTEDTVYPDHEAQLNRNDSVIIFSDGLTDIRNNQNEMFGEDRIAETMRASAGSTVDTQLERLKQHLTRHLAGREPSDDMTVIIGCFKGRVDAGIATSTV